MADLQSIQNVPQGLLDLLGMKGSGQNPRSLDSVVQGTLDLRQLYALARLATVVGPTNVGGAGTESEVIVPAAEHWIVLQMFALFTATAATTTYMQGGLFIGPGGAAGELGVVDRVNNLGDNTAFPINTNFQVPWFAPYPFIVRPGGSLKARVQQTIGAGNIAVAMQANIGILS